MSIKAMSRVWDQSSHRGNTLLTILDRDKPWFEDRQPMLEQNVIFVDRHFKSDGTAIDFPSLSETPAGVDKPGCVHPAIGKALVGCPEFRRILGRY